MDKKVVKKVAKPVNPNFLKELEKKGEANAKIIVKNLSENGNVNIAMKSVENVLQKGFDEFEKECGRKMTYGEMRELYG